MAADPLEYPWNGGTYAPTDVRVFRPDEEDEEGTVPGCWIVGAGDYCDEGTPDLIVTLHADTPPSVVEWVADAFRSALLPSAVGDDK